MPISRLLLEANLSAEQRHFYELAFNTALCKLNLVDRGDPVCELVARKIIEVGSSGVSNAVALSEIAVRELLAK